MNIVITNQHCDNRGDESAVIGLVKTIYDEFGADTNIDMYVQTKGYRFVTEDLGINEHPMFTSTGKVLAASLWVMFKSIGLDIRGILPKETKVLIKTYENADLVLSSCGGPYIGDIYIDHEIFHIFYAKMAKLLKKPLVFSAPSMGPFRKGFMNPFRRKLLKQADAIVLRDNVSYGLVNEFAADQSKVFLTADACLAHDLTEFVVPFEQKKNIIGFTPIEFYGFTDEEKENYKREMTKVFDALMEEDRELKIEFFPQLYNKHTDMPLIKDMISRLKYPERAIVFSNEKSGAEQQKEISSMKLMVATRYHSAVFACKMQVPCVCIAYEHKAVGMMDLFGLSDCVMDIRSVSAEAVREKIAYVAQNARRIYDTQEKNGKAIRETARRTVKIAKAAYNGELPEKTAPVRFFDDIIKHRFLCKNCGECADVCPTRSITYEQNRYKQFMPKLKELICINCGKCVKACAARDIKSHGESVLGKVRAIYAARAADEGVNGAATSGGVISTLLKYGLENGYFESVTAADYASDNIVAEPVMYTAAGDIPSGSKYICRPMNTHLNEHRGSFAATLLPCQATAARRQYGERAFIFGLFCSKMSTEELATYMAGRMGVKKDDIASVSYRKGIWPGRFTLKLKDGSEKSCPYNRSLFTAVFNSYVFANEGCLMCADYFSEEADISFGDPWGRRAEYSEGYKGETIVVIRSEKGERLYNEAVKSGLVISEQIPAKNVIKGHLSGIYTKKTSLRGRIDKVQKNGVQYFNVEKGAFISGSIKKSCNRFMEYNNRKLKRSKMSKLLLKAPAKLLFAYRYADAYRLKKFLKKKSYYEYYCGVRKEYGDNDK